MKRSEALQIIKEYLDINGGQINQEQVLAIVEKIGMLPPFQIPQLEYLGLDDSKEHRLFKRISDGTILRNPINSPLYMAGFDWEAE